MCTGMATNVGYFLRESVRSFRRNWVMSLGAIITIYLSLMLIGLSVGSGFLLGSVISSVEDKVSVRVFLADEAPAEAVDALQAEIAANPAVSEVQYTSKEEALEQFKASLVEDNPEIVEQLDENVLPASIDVNLEDAQLVESVVATIQASPSFLQVADNPEDPSESIKYGEDVVSKLLSFTRVLRIISYVVIVLLGVMSLVFISNAIRVAIYARRKEIGIMRLVGASNWFIRGPFLFEGIIQSLIAAIFAIASLAVVWLYVLPLIADSVTFLPLSLTNTEAGQTALILVLAGLVIGLMGSGLAMRRYLKV